jgi:hypothetical protein
MKGIVITLLLVLALPLVARAETKQLMIHGRTVTVVTEKTSDTVLASQAAIDKSLHVQGWHDHILRSQEANKAFMVFSRRDNPDAASAKTVEVVLWKAIAKDGTTYTETWTYSIPAGELNPFLDKELPALTEEFKSAPIQYTVTIG